MTTILKKCMKKKTIRNLLILVFALGFVVGFLIPWDFRDVKPIKLQASIFDVPKKFGQLDQGNEYFKYTTLADAKTGNIFLLRVDSTVPNHKHKEENHFAYIYRGRARITIGDVSSEVGPGQMIVFPAGTPHRIERIGDTPVEAMVFSTPAFDANDIEWLEESK